MKSKKGLVVVLLLLVALMIIFPLWRIKDSEFGGADDQAEDLISEIAPGYEPWAEPVMEPPGGETESLIFCIQTGIGAAILGYGFGYLVCRKKFTDKKDGKSNNKPAEA